MTSPDPTTHRVPGEPRPSGRPGAPQPESAEHRHDTDRRDEHGRLLGGRPGAGRPVREPGADTDHSIAEEVIDYFTVSGDADSPASDADAPPPG